MKIFRNKAILPVLFFVCGILYFFEPILSGWMEIVDPAIAAELLLPMKLIVFTISLPFYLLAFAVLGNENSLIVAYVIDILFLLAFLGYLVYFMGIIRKKWSPNQTRLALVPLVVLPMLWFALLPIGATKIERRINSFSIGGWTRMMFAGGSTIVRSDGIKLLESTNQEEPGMDEWPSSIKNLGGWVVAEKDKQLLLIGIGRMFNMADEFGFIIPKEIGETPIPRYLEKSQFYRIWKIADGIYFFER
jgi:hypothetical protein